MAQPDPSHSVPQDLMPHMHLLSSFRYPAIPRLDFNEVAKWLLSAPQIARDRAPFFWTYLDKPADGTIFMTWQPLQRLGTNFATDGFIWAPPEQIYKHDLGNDLMLEIYYLKAGYLPGDQFALHARRRFRLVPVAGHPNSPQPDPNLFIVHYGPAEPNDRIPISMIPYDERVNAIMQQRHFLLRGGQIRRKEFMLSDRANWPHLPELTRQQMGPQVTPRGVPQQMAYPTQPPPGPPAKRPRHAQNQAQQGNMPGMPPMDLAFDDDEDISRGDMFDHLTPREMSMSRYSQNHEWMEEILSSAYRMNQIEPTGLGLGLKGELAALTEGIFAAQGAEALNEVPEKVYVGRLDAGKAEEFRKRVENYVSTAKSEMKQMEDQHLQAIATLKEASFYKLKERELRSIPVDGSGSEIWRVENPIHPIDVSDGNDETSRKSAETIVQQLEAMTGRKIASTPAIHRIHDGGYQAPAPEPAIPAPTMDISRQPSEAGSQASALGLGENDMDMGGTAAGLLDEMHIGLSTPTPANSLPTPQAQFSATQSGEATPLQVANTASPSATATAAPKPPASDVQMGGTDAEPRTTPDQGTGSGDWIVVSKGETSAANPESSAAAAGAATATTTETTAASTTTTTTAMAPTATNPEPTELDDSKPEVSTTTKPSSPAATPAITEGGSVSFDQNDFSSLGDLDTAGDALAGYEASDLDGGSGGLGDGLDLQMDMEDSAFGDAFHGVEGSATPGDGQGQDM